MSLPLKIRNTAGGQAVAKAFFQGSFGHFPASLIIIIADIGKCIFHFPFHVDNRSAVLADSLIAVGGIGETSDRENSADSGGSGGGDGRLFIIRRVIGKP